MEWQPIETAPKDGTTVLLWSRADGHHIAWYHTGDAPVWLSHMSWMEGIYNLAPTHWAPLTEPADEP